MLTMLLPFAVVLCCMVLIMPCLFVCCSLSSSGVCFVENQQCPSAPQLHLTPVCLLGRRLHTCILQQKWHHLPRSSATPNRAACTTQQQQWGNNNKNGTTSDHLGRGIECKAGVLCRASKVCIGLVADLQPSCGACLLCHVNGVVLVAVCALLLEHHQQHHHCHD